MGRLFKSPPFEFSGNATVPVRIIEDSQVANKICCSLSSYAPKSGSGLAVTSKSHGLHGLKHRSRGQSATHSSILLLEGDALSTRQGLGLGGLMCELLVVGVGGVGARVWGVWCVWQGVACG